MTERTGLPGKILAVHDTLTDAGLLHAFGGALALAYCVGEPRATADIDVNIFLDAAEAGRAIGALPTAVARDESKVAEAQQDGQVRLFWDDTPLDLFFNTVDFHRAAARRIAHVPFAQVTIPVLSCTDLAVCKAMFARSKDWVDIEAMAGQAGTLDQNEALSWVGRMLGEDHPQTARLRDLFTAGSPSGGADDSQAGIRPGGSDSLPSALRPKQGKSG